MKREALRTLMGRIFVARMLLAPVFLTVVGTAVALGPDPWRVWGACALATSILLLFGIEFWRWTQGWAGPAALAPNLVAMLWIQLGVVVLSGGLEGPLFPLLPMVALQFATLFGPGRYLAAVVGAQLAAVWILAGTNAVGGSVAIAAFQQPGIEPVVQASALTVMILGAITIGSKIRSIVADLVSSGIAAHDRERTAHAEHARELVALTGEIAHELKNPLASIKGLAALLARDPTLDAKPAERLAVLRAEVDRMQETLDRFLDLSRPLVPLTQTTVDLAELVSDVLAVSDGLARARGVTLRADVHGLSAHADRRKLRQVLVNLVQNALDAAPGGSEVAVTGADCGSTVEIAVEDAGPGIPEELREAAFDPGVTTRPHGSGLGLTIARALVRQHAGTLHLEPRPGGGTRALMRLPTHGSPP